ncbi:hypothetical protein [Moorena sp. SIO3I8]|uniref:hypothetical protein n=1 Tax=Moorena sp. SIO3I8 TaxID=2607833 RepID=UPI0025F3F162|nr:hypothetical protein [Moorena sp. SIO3I8]
MMVSVIWNQRAWPVYWSFLSKKGSSNLKEQQEVLAMQRGLGGFPHERLHQDRKKF